MRVPTGKITRDRSATLRAGPIGVRHAGDDIVSRRCGIGKGDARRELRESATFSAELGCQQRCARRTLVHERRDASIEALERTLGCWSRGVSAPVTQQLPWLEASRAGAREGDPRGDPEQRRDRHRMTVPVRAQHRRTRDGFRPIGSGARRGSGYGRSVKRVLAVRPTLLTSSVATTDAVQIPGSSVGESSNVMLDAVPHPVQVAVEEMMICPVTTLR